MYIIRFFIYILLILCTIQGISQNQKSAVRCLKKADKALRKSDFLSYYASLQIKEAMQLDTFKTEGKVSLRKNKSDVFFGYDLMTETTQMTNYYSLGKFYRLDNINQKIYPGRLLDPKLVSKKQGPFYQSHSDNLFDEWLRYDSALYYLSQDQHFEFKKVKGKLCSKEITIKAKWIPGEIIYHTDTLTGYELELVFDRKTKMPLKITKRALGRWSNFFWQIEFSHTTTSMDSIDYFFDFYSFPTDFELVENTVTTSKTKTETIKPTKAPEIILQDYRGKTVNLNDLKGKVVVLDFWYSTCAPCLKASKFLETYIEKYSSEGLVVLGMNPVDNIPRIEKHYNKWNMSYNTLICNEELKIKLEANSYPTFIVIDRTGNIVYRSAGFSATLMGHLETAIKNALEAEEN